MCIRDRPTPLHKLQRLGLEAGHEELYIKRDDLSGIGLGGNKTRSLEFLLGDALDEGDVYKRQLIKKARNFCTPMGTQT